LLPFLPSPAENAEKNQNFIRFNLVFLFYLNWFHEHQQGYQYFYIASLDHIIQCCWVHIVCSRGKI